jgi:hypothetical protein
LTEAVSHRIREQLAGDFEQQRRELNAAMEAREIKLASAETQIATREEALQAELARCLEAERQKLITAAFQKAELDLRKQQRELEEAKGSLELQVARTLDAERAGIAEKARREAIAEIKTLELAAETNSGVD